MTDETDTESSKPFVRVWRSIATDQDFIDLDPDAKVVYFRLLIDPDNNAAGLFTLTVKRWAKWANISPERVLAALRLLHAAHFVVLDDEYDEVVIRTKLRNDTLIGASSWKTQKGALSATLKAVSPDIRATLADEVEKCRDRFRPQVVEYAESVVRKLRGDAGMEAGIEA